MSHYNKYFRKCTIEELKEAVKVLDTYAIDFKIESPTPMPIRPTKEELEELIQTTPMTKIGKKYNVSDNAIRKWAKKFNIKLPNRLGYWTKVKYNKV